MKISSKVAGTLNPMTTNITKNTTNPRISKRTPISVQLERIWWRGNPFDKLVLMVDMVKAFLVYSTRCWTWLVVLQSCQVLSWNTLMFLDFQISQDVIAKNMMQSYPPRALDRRLQEDWTKDAEKGPRVLTNFLQNID